MDYLGVPPPVMDWESPNFPEAWDKFQKHAGPYKAKTEAEKIAYTFSSG